jgi:Reverse transcriptase (RNA-dependent DNA polymerase)
MEYQHLISDPITRADWQTSAATEFGQLAQGVGGRIKGTDTITFIPHHAMPADRKATYPRFVCSEQPQKTEKNRTRMTVGGNLIDYPGDKSTNTVELETTKILLNSVISTPDAWFSTMDITNFYLNTPLDRPEYLCIPINLIPEDIIKEYELQAIVNNGNVMARINKGMYGLPQASILANQLFKDWLAPHGYTKCDHTPSLWHHKTRPIKFVLVVDDFSIKYSSIKDTQHLLAVLKQHYEAIMVDWDGTLYCSITLDWNYDQHTVDLSMPDYVQMVLDDFNHVPTNRAKHQPHRHNPPQYGVKTQLMDPIDVTAPLDDKGNLQLQQITGKFQYYSRAVDLTMNVMLSTLASPQTCGTQQTKKDSHKFLNYCATHPNAKICYHASNMILKVHSDASYNSKPKACS